MKKIILSLYVILSVNINGAEPVLGILKDISSTSSFTLSVKGNDVVCMPYGVITLEEMLDTTLLPESCQTIIRTMYQKNPQLGTFPWKHLKIFQQYHIEQHGKRCTLYVKGRQSYAELLIKEGLAMRKPLLRDDLWLYRWKKAQQGARNQKDGIWMYQVWNACANNIYAVEDQ